MTPSTSSPAAGPTPQWPSLLRVALLGTRQSPDSVPALLGSAKPEQVPGNDSREQQLLLSAGTLALMRRAGYQPPVASDFTAPTAKPDAQPTLGPLGADCLRRMVVDSMFLDFLPDYLRQVAATGRRVPNDLLVPLLRHATRSPDTTATLPPVLGVRGRWLATLHPEWHSLLGTSATPPNTDPSTGPDLSTWETGTLAQRRNWLQEQFAQDPDAARALVLAALPTEPAKVQEAFLEILADHLHPDAEPVLETLLRARGQEVRRQAAALLVRLPSAALLERLWARAEPLLHLKRGGLLGLGKSSLEITLPTTWDKSWLADGIEEQNTQYAYQAGGTKSVPLGPSGIRLGNLLALLPPSRWTTHFRLAPDELLELALASEWAVPLLPGWAQSTLLHQDVDFAAAFVSLWLHKRPSLQKARVDRNISWAALTELLPAPVRQSLLLKPMLLRVRRQEPKWTEDLLQLPTPWPRELTTEVVQTIGTKLANSASVERFHSDLYQLSYFLSQHLAPAVAPTDAAWVESTLLALPEVHATFQNSLQIMLQILRFRTDLTNSLLEN